MNKEKKVSVIVPVYNSEKYIERCIESIINQTYTDYEIIVINDGSTDNSKKIIEKYVDKYENIKLINQENKGVATTRNETIKMVNTKYLMFMDNDDFIDANYIENYITKIEETNSDIVMGGYKRVNIDNKIMFEQKLIASEWSKYVVLAPWAKIYKTSFLKENNIEFFKYGIGEDVYFNLTAYANNPKIEIINDTGYNWFFNTKSVSNTSQRGLNESIDITVLLDEIIKKYDNKDELFCYYLKRYVIWYLLFSGRKTSKEKFVEHYKLYEKWLGNNNIYNIISPFSSKLKGESFKNRIIVGLFIFIEKMNLMGLFSKVYCKGK